MKAATKWLGQCLAEERGQMLAWTLIVTMAGSLIIGGFLIYASTSLLTTADSGNRVRAYYTTEAGADTCLVALSQGQSICPASLSLNGYTAIITLTDSVTSQVPSASRYLPTGLEGITLTAGSAWILELNSRPLTIQVNWPFTPTLSPWEIRLYKGEGIEGTPVVTSTGIWSPAQLLAPASVVTDGVHTILFYNTAPITTTVAAPFLVSSTGTITDFNYTWVWANAYRDYMVTSSAGGQVLEVMARQIPGSSLITNPVTMSVSSWQFR